jgi:hypothetical protein
MSEPPHEYRLQLGPPERMVYDREFGTVRTLVDEQVREEIRIRAELRDRFVRLAVVEELRLLGYTVTEP